jgi:hypothetical protein
MWEDIAKWDFSHPSLEKKIKSLDSIVLSPLTCRSLYAPVGPHDDPYAFIEDLIKEPHSPHPPKDNQIEKVTDSGELEHPLKLARRNARPAYSYPISILEAIEDEFTNAQNGILMIYSYIAKTQKNRDDRLVILNMHRNAMRVAVSVINGTSVDIVTTVLCDDKIDLLIDWSQTMMAKALRLESFPAHISTLIEEEEIVFDSNVGKAHDYVLKSLSKAHALMDFDSPNFTARIEYFKYNLTIVMNNSISNRKRN